MPDETIICAACHARIAPDLVTPEELRRLRAFFRQRGTDVCGQEESPPQPVPCPWCGVGELKIIEATDTEEVEVTDEMEDEPDTSFYYPRPRPCHPDEMLVVDFNSYSEVEICTGYLEVTPNDPDYELWCWICDRRKRFSRVTDEDLPMIRDEFRQWQRGWLPWFWHRLTHRRRSGWVRSGREHGC